MNNWFKQNGIHLAIIAGFIVLCFIYFSPVLQGKAPEQGDVIQSKAMQTEIMDFKQKDGKGPLWTNQMFGGMPTYQIWVQYAYNAATYGIGLVTKAMPNPVGTVLLLLIGAYFLFNVLKLNPWLAAAGAIAFAFTTYNFVLIATGHSNKALAIGFFAPIIAGIILTMRGRFWLGAALTALFLALEIRANHIQMTYYLFLAILILVGIEIYQANKNKTMPSFWKSMGFLSASVIIALMVNASLLWTTSEYAQQTNRGKSNLTNAAGKTEGMSKEYAYGWSQGVGESLSVLIPDLYGGASSVDLLVKKESNLYQAVSQNLTGGDPAGTEQAIGALGAQFGMVQYWGEKPGTSGGYYYGAIVCFLFVFGLFIVKSRLKWWVLSVTILFTLLSLGKNFSFFSDLFFDYFPLYNKFRAVESILAVVGLMVPILAFMAVKEALETKMDTKELLKKLKISAAITGGFALVVTLFPTLFFDFKTDSHELIIQELAKVLQGNVTIANQIGDALVLDRVAIARADAIRTLLFIVIAFGIMWAMITHRLKAQVAFILLTFAVLIDMWQIDKRYLNNDNFKSKTQLANVIAPRDVDGFIKADKDPHYRVYDQTINTFSSANASAFHKTIGGYHAAKLKRYDELIQKQFSASVNQDVLDMLNARYFITQDPQNGSYKMIRNQTALGNAWVVKSLKYVRNADEEMNAINSFDPKNEAIVDVQFSKLIDTAKLGTNINTLINLDQYHPDHMVYSYSAPKDVIAVFSEVYYDKGWKMYVDGEEKPHFRANYVLRAAQLPAGNHKVEFKFEPASYYTGEKISLAGSILMLAFLGFGFYQDRKQKKS